MAAGILAISTLGLPGVQGAGVTGIQGMGVSTPSAAVVAAATAGFAKELHIPKGKILTKGLLSIIFAAGFLSVITRLVGKTIKDEGAKPKEHCNSAPIQSCCPIVVVLCFLCVRYFVSKILTHKLFSVF